MAGFVITTDEWGFLIFLPGLILEIIMSVALVRFVKRQGRKLRANYAVRQFSVVHSELLILRSTPRHLFVVATLVFLGFIIAVGSTTELVPDDPALEGFPELRPELWEYVLVAIYAYSIMLLPWVLAVEAFGRAIVATRDGVEKVSPLGRSFSVAWNEIEVMHVYPRRRITSCQLATVRGRIGLHHEMLGFGRFAAMVSANLPAEKIRVTK